MIRNAPVKILSLEHDLFGKPVSTFPDHAQAAVLADEFGRVVPEAWNSSALG
jgi:hypothetical protein